MDALALRPVQKFLEVIVDPIVILLFAAATFYFVWGVFDMIRQADDSSARTDGRNHILWGTVGLFIMFSVWGIISILKSTIGA